MVETTHEATGGPRRLERVGASPVSVTLIRPAMVFSLGTWSTQVTPPLALAYLAAMLRENGTPVRTIDAIGEAVDQYTQSDGYCYQGLTIPETVDRIDPATNLIGVSCMFSQDWPWLAELIRAIRERFPDALIIAGGEHVSALPEFSLRDCDALDVCVLGEGEETIVDLVDHLEAGGGSWSEITGIAWLRDGEYVQSEPRARIRAVDDIPRPAWDLFPMEVYLGHRNAHGVYRGRSMGILATRGCPYKCTFCSNPVMYGVLWKARSPSDVLDEIQEDIETWGAENIDFYDLTMILKRSWILDFCRQIEERGLKFTWQLPSGTRSEVVDDEVAAALYRTGCRNMTYSPESGSPETLKNIEKRVKLPNMVESTRAALRNGIRVKCNMIIGFPQETRREIWETIRFGWKLAAIGVNDIAVFMFSPYPGSALFDGLREDGVIQELDDDYFRSLAALGDIAGATDYCRAVRGRELALWRLFAMVSFVGLSFLLRPARLVRLVRNVIRDESDTVLEQRLGALVRRLLRGSSTQQAPATITANH